MREKQKALKLHQQFAHPTEERLVKLLRESKGFKEDEELMELISEVSSECEVCEKFTKPKPRPIVGMPIARQFNEVVCMDLFEFETKKVWVLHFIDAFSRRSNAVFIKTKKDTEIIKHMYTSWIKHHGSPKRFLTDNGGEFANEKYKEMNEKLNIEVCHTAAESPWSNGMVERHNAVLKECLQKTITDTKCDPKIGLGWAVSAKNSLFNNNGFTPDQLTYGRNCNYPSVLIDEPPALESSTTVDVIRENMNAMHKAREAFIESESSERIRRALRHNIRTYANGTYQNGESVYYRRKNFKGWKGPGVVLGKDGQTVLIKHGSTYCHRSSLSILKKKAVPKDASQASLTKDANGPSVKQTLRQSVSDQQMNKEMIETDEEDDEEEYMNDGTEALETDHPTQSNAIDIQNDTNEEITRDELLPDEIDVQNDTNEAITRDESLPDEIGVQSNANEVLTEDENDIQSNANEGNNDELHRNVVDKEQVPVQMDLNEKINNSSQWPKNKTYIQYEEDGVWKEALVLSAQPKRNGKHKEWLNIQVTGENAPRSIAWKEVNAWKPVKTATENVLWLSQNQEWDQDVINAKKKEINNLKEHNVYEEVNNTRKERCISARWILTEKYVDGKKIVKARLVARGFEEDSSMMTKDSPTCTKESLRIVFTAAATQKWKMQALDISSAFLQGNKIQRDVYILPPKDVRTDGVVWKLKRCIYGLNDAPRAWYDKVKSEMISLGAVVSKYDHSLFMWHNNGLLIGILVTHVDDFTFAGTAEWEKKVIGNLRQKFKISAYHTTSFKYIGLSVEQTNEEIKISQNKYVSEIEPIEMSSVRRKDANEPLNNKEKKELKALVGQMSWVTNHTRPDMSFETCVMSNAGNARVKNVLEANKAVMKLKRKNCQ